MKEYYLDKIKNTKNYCVLSSTLQDLIESWYKGFVNDHDYEFLRDIIISKMETAVHELL